MPDVHLDDEITTPYEARSWGIGISAPMFRERIAAAGDGDITLRVNSPGGVVTEGLAMYAHLQDLRAAGRKITCIIEGVAASMANTGVFNPDRELFGQGLASVGSALFGGMPATGTIARTVTNVKNGGNSPVAGMVHALTLLVVMLVAAPLAGDVPLAALSAILMFVAWNMGEWHEFVHLRQFRLPYRATLLSVFLLTVIVDLTVAVEVGLMAACLTFIYRISSLSRAEHVQADAFPELAGCDTTVQAHRLYGALFFGAVKLVEAIEESLPTKALVLDLKNLIYVDSSGADALLALARSCKKKQVRLIVCGLAHQPLDMAQRSGLLQALPDTDLVPDLSHGLALALGR